MGFLFQIHAIRMGLCIKYFRGSHRLKFPNYDVFLSLMIVLTSAKSVEPDEMPHYAAFHLGLHCLPKYRFRRFKHTKGHSIIHIKISNSFVFKVLEYWFGDHVMRHFIWVFTVCQSTRLGVSSIQKVNIKYCSLISFILINISNSFVFMVLEYWFGDHAI